VFERHFAHVIGVSEEAAGWLLDGAQRRLGWSSYLGRTSAFLAATTLPGSLLPDGARHRAVRGLLDPALTSHAETAVLLGLREPGSRVCAGLVAAA
jgi:hypothetical protein